jgi:hypothetical protein
LPLIAGIAELAYFVEVGRPKSTGGQLQAYFSGCLLMMVGLVVAGPWLTMVGSRAMARRTSRPAVLIAGRRLSDNPRGAFRAISGLILSLFATSVSVGVITTIIDYQGSSSGGAVANRTLIDEVYGVQTAPGQPPTSLASMPTTLSAELSSIQGVQGVTVIHSVPSADPSGDAGPNVVTLCAQLAHTPAIGRCASGVDVVTISGNLDSGGTVTSRSSLAARQWPAAPMSPAQVQSLPIRAIVVGTNGSSVALERARTALEVALPYEGQTTSLGEISAQDSRLTIELRQLTNVVILVSLVVAGCSLAVSVTAGVNDRKRPFSLLRLTGVPTAALRRVVALEAAVPLLVIAVLSAGSGLLAAALFLRSQLGESLRPPGLDYYVMVVAGLVASLAIIASTLPLIERITGPEVARNE